jgi:hypothetical protein
MKFHIENGMGDSIDNPTPEQMREFLFALDTSDEEHGDADLSTELGYSLSWFGDERLVLAVRGGVTGAQEASVRHLANVTRERALELWNVLARGDISALEREPWRSGHGYVRTPEKAAAMEAAVRHYHRQFYEGLGPEREDIRCRHEGCSRGAILHSVLCRPHHFESVHGIPSPFDD